MRKRRTSKERRRRKNDEDGYDGEGLPTS